MANTNWTLISSYPGLRKDTIKTHKNDYKPVYLSVYRDTDGRIRLCFEFNKVSGHLTSIEAKLSWFMLNFEPNAEGMAFGAGSPPDPIGPGFWGSPRCRSHSLASGGSNAHCACNTCF